MIDIIIGLLLVFSAVISLIAGIGMLRLKDLFSRMHTLTKVSSLGLLLILVAVNLYGLNLWVLLKTMLIFTALIFLAPAAAYMLAKVSKNE
ncbi:monovalent cation/H(+) antiporter subunit G [Marinilabiliaceae bacterium JC017]|nr:monovalent cation/H(+) antiporter subunit G [Marinilabiliaceae bacterium JC017]